MSTNAIANRIGSTEQILLEGGDARIAVEPALRLNRYLCSPHPDAGVAAFGSSTASSISQPAFAAADKLRRELRLRLEDEAPAAVYAGELQRMRAELVRWCALSELRGLGLTFAASGTDIHLLAAQLTVSAAAAPVLVIVMDGAETGSGVPAALRGEHFSDCSALGVRAAAGTPLAGRRELEVAAVALRAAGGAARDAAAVDLEVEALALGAIKRGRRVLLIAADVSKTGLLAPSASCVRDLRQYAPERIDVMVDACQFRIAASTLRGYLESGCMVALTGSKFLTGPAFSGALMVPPALCARLRRARLPRALAAYSAQAEWPAGWAAIEALDDSANFGLLLRWEAALAELRAFRSVPEPEVERTLNTFASAIRARLESDPAFQAVPVPALQRCAGSWDRVQTIFPFTLRRPGAARAQTLNEAETQRIYRLLQADLQGAAALARLRFLLGQPVRCGDALSALRICAGARLVTESRGNAAAAIEHAMAALDKAAWLVRRGLHREPA